MSNQNIEEKYKKLFKYISLAELPEGLEKRVLSAITKNERQTARLKNWIFGGISTISFAFSSWAVIYLVKSVESSGLWQYLSLAFSENGTLLAFWKEFSLTLAESLPITSIVMFLITIGLFIWSITKITKKSYAFQY
jgi:hypothetical protein